MDPNPLHILLVEDDEVETEAMLRTFQRQKFSYPLTIASNGLEALDLLRGEPDQAPLPQPYLILLDLDMPQMNGLEFLQVLRSDPCLKQSVVFILTTSDRDEDKRAAYNQQVAGYLLKSKVGTNFEPLIGLFNFYQQTVEFPH